MPQFVLTTLAAADYRKTLRDSRQQFGQYQRDRYKTILDTAIHEVVENPHSPRSRKRDELAPGIRTYYLGGRGQRASHFLVYRLLESGIVEITRILHVRMEMVNYLPEENKFGERKPGHPQ